MSFCRRIHRVKQVEVDTVGIEYETTIYPGNENVTRPMCLLRAPQINDSGGGGYDLAYALAKRVIELEAKVAGFDAARKSFEVQHLPKPLKPAPPIDPDFNDSRKESHDPSRS
jgi:hypothetical protein